MPKLSQQGRSEVLGTIPDTNGAKEFIAGLPYIGAFAASGAATASVVVATHGFLTPVHVEVTIAKATAPTQCLVSWSISGSTVTLTFYKFTNSGSTVLASDTGAISGTVAIWGTTRSY